MTSLRPRLILTLILFLYLALGVLFAVNTPPWQAPDEPAHYNYIRYLTERDQFPILHMGDYPHAYLEEIKSRKFPPDLSIDPIRYEFHQPPLYYALTAPVYVLTGGNLIALRLFSVGLGAGIVILAYAISRRVCPVWLALALGTAAFVAFLPQHLATVAQVGNDVLAELLFAAVLLVLVGWVDQEARDKGQRAKDKGRRARGERQDARRRTRSAIGLGILLGLVLITKTTAYVAVPLAAGVLIWRWWREKEHFRRIVSEGLAVVVPAAFIALPWYGRDLWVYGWPDFLGLIRHDQIVIDQPRTAEWLAQYGVGGYLHRLVEFTFKSFWGVFGWLGVFMDSRIYFALALLSGVAAGGLLLKIVNDRRPVAGGHQPSTGNCSPFAIRLLAVSTLLTLLVYAWYNLQFVQHQGRYLFTALIPIAIFFSLGWEAALRPHASRVMAAVLIIFGLGLAAWGLLWGHGLPKWPLAITVALAVCLAIRPWLPRRLDTLLFALPFAALPLLDLYALFGAIVPQLMR